MTAHVVYPVVSMAWHWHVWLCPYTVVLVTFMHRMQEVQRYCHDCCAAAKPLHAGSVVMRDFRIPNVLTRNGAEGSYVISDLEFAGPDKHPWTLDYLQGWDHHTLNQVILVMRSYNLT